jgi:hypothetical protein
VANERALANPHKVEREKNGNVKRGDKTALENRSGSNRSSSDSTRKQDKQRDLRGFFERS